MSITKFLPPGRTFGPEAMEAMRIAYAEAIAAAGISVSGPQAARDVVAKRIIDAAIAGESAPDQLCGVALASLGLKR